MVQLIENPPHDTTQFQPKVRLILDAVRRGITADLKAKVLSGIDKLVASLHPHGKSMDELHNLSENVAFPDHRILCLTEGPTHAAMWYHYADKYRGVVFEFRCIDELDTASFTARPFTYPLSKPAIYTADGWANLLCFQQDKAIESHVGRGDLHQGAKLELRGCMEDASFKRHGESGHYSDYKFYQRRARCCVPRPNDLGRRSFVAAHRIRSLSHGAVAGRDHCNEP